VATGRHIGPPTGRTGPSASPWTQASPALLLPFASVHTLSTAARRTLTRCMTALRGATDVALPDVTAGDVSPDLVTGSTNTGSSLATGLEVPTTTEDAWHEDATGLAAAL